MSIWDYKDTPENRQRLIDAANKATEQYFQDKKINKIKSDIKKGKIKPDFGYKKYLA